MMRATCSGRSGRFHRTPGSHDGTGPRPAQPARPAPWLRRDDRQLRRRASRAPAHAGDADASGRRDFGLPATVVTFEPTPREFFEGDAAPARLMRLREKVEALPLYGVDRVRGAALRPPHAGHGCGRSSSTACWSAGSVRVTSSSGTTSISRGVAKATIETLRDGGRRARIRGRGGRTVPGRRRARVSSSLVREALGRGDLERTRTLLGRPYRMAGRVRRGQQLGRKLGYPTANLALHRKVVPLWGSLRRARERGGARRSPRRGEPRHAPDDQRHRTAARGARIRLRRRPLWPLPRRGFRAAAA